jgi:hypothetical protein
MLFSLGIETNESYILDLTGLNLMASLLGINIIYQIFV